MVSNVVAARFSLNSLKERGSNEALRSQHLNTPVAPACHVEAFLTRRSRSEGGSDDGSLARKADQPLSSDRHAVCLESRYVWCVACRAALLGARGRRRNF